MARLTEYRFAPIGNDDLFEDMCCRLWRHLWDDPNAQRHGRNGQAQQGVDIVGLSKDQGGFCGVQCKAVDKPLTEKELQSEIDAAKNFRPPLKWLVVATAAPKDAKLERYARVVTVAHLEAGLFPVTVLGWRDIEEYLAPYPDLIEQFFGVPVQSTEVAAKVEIALLPHIMSLGNRIVEQDSQIKSLHSRSLDGIRDAINAFRYHEALRRLDEFKRDYWSVVDAALKYRVTYYQAQVHYLLGDSATASRGYLEAYSFKPDDESAAAHAALAYLLAGDKKTATERARLVLELHPASSLACSILINALEEEADLDLFWFNTVPAPLRTSAEPLMNMAIVSRLRGDIEAAERWIREAVVHDKDKDSAIYGLLGEILFAKATAEIPDVRMAALQAYPNALSLLAEAETAFSIAWEKVSGTDLQVNVVSWLINRGALRRLQGKSDEGLSDIEQALQIAPKHLDALRLRAVIAIERNNRQLGEQLLRQCLFRTDLENRASYVAPLIQSLLETNTPDSLAESIKILDKAIAVSQREDEKDSFECLQAQVAVLTGDSERAVRLLTQSLQRIPRNLKAVVAAASVARQIGRDIDVGETRFSLQMLLSEAVKLAGSSEDYASLSNLASELYRNERFSEAATAYERLVIPGVVDFASLGALISHYNAGNLGPASKIAQKLLEANGPSVTVSELALHIAEEIGPRSTARQIAEDYYREFPDDTRMWIKLAKLCEMQKDFSALDRFLDKKMVANELTVQDAIFFSGILERRGRLEDCLRFNYEIREQFHNQASAHRNYTTRFIELTMQQHFPILDVLNGVAVETTVTVEEEPGIQQVYWIEAKPFRHDEYHLVPDHPLALRLIGMHSGDTVTLSESNINMRKMVIKEIKSKYVQAFQDSSSNYEKWFPDAGGFWMMRLQQMDANLENSENEVDFDVQPILNLIEKHSTRVSESLAYYKDKNLPVHVAGKYLGENIWQIWSRLTSQSEVPLRCCHGSLDQQIEALGLLQRGGRFVVDPLTLLSLFHLPVGVRTAVVSITGKMIISQSVLDVVHNLADGQNVGSVGRWQLNARTAPNDNLSEGLFGEGVDTLAERVNEFAEWIEANTEVYPVRLLLGTDALKLREFRHLLGNAYADPTFIAKELGFLLLSDDLSLRQFAFQEFTVHGVWTQALLMHARKQGVLTPEAYQEAVIWLIQNNYLYTAIEPATIQYAAAKVDWSGKGIYLRVIDILSGNSSEANTISVGAEAIALLIHNAPSPFRLSANIMPLLEAICSGRQRLNALQQLEAVLKARLQMLPNDLRVAITHIEIWKALHIL